MTDIQVKEVNAKDASYQQVWDLREKVLRQPLGMSLKGEDLSMDHEDRIFIALHDGKVIGCLMLHSLDGHTIKFRQMAVYDAWQGKNIGLQLMTEAEKAAKRDGYKHVTLHARKVAMGFYAKLGYAISSNEFTEVGIPHVVMEKTLN